MSVTYEGVTFITAACQGMSRQAFIDKHIDAFWQDRTKAARTKMLAKAYDLMFPPAKGKE